MPANLVPALGYILATGMAGLAAYYWRRSSGLYSLLVEGANRFEELRQRSAQVEAILQKANDRQKELKDQVARLERSVEESREKSAQLVSRLEGKEAEVKFVTEKLELQKGHLEKQLGKALDQIQAHQERLAETEVRATGRQAELEQRYQVLKQEAALRDKDLSLQVRDLQAKLRQLEADKAQAAKAGPAVDAAEVKRIKRKLAQYDRLYSGMKGQRDMVEERNRNWEVALRRLAGWVLRETGGPLANLPENIGPLVGNALGAIGAQLIDDSEPDPALARDGALRADDMDPELDDHLPLDDDSGISDQARDAALHPERVAMKPLRQGNA
jgi:hypothetical protein